MVRKGLVYVIDKLGGMIAMLSLECLLKIYPNGGTVIFVRTAASGTLLFLLATGLEHWPDPDRTCTPSLTELGLSVKAHVEWIGVIFAAIYAAFYTRFSSQWTYLAGLYNQIKETEVAMCPEAGAKGCGESSAMAEWKAGFVTDALTLHLATKDPFRGVIANWAKSSVVKDSFCQSVPREKAKWAALTHEIGVDCLDESCTDCQSKYRRAPVEAPPQGDPP